MNALGSSRKYGTLLPRRIANGNHRVEFLPFEFRNRLGTMTRNIDPDFPHRFHRQRTDPAVRLAPSAVNFVGAPAKLTEQPFRHLAADAIPGAKDENAMGHESGPGNNSRTATWRATRRFRRRLHRAHERADEFPVNLRTNNF